MNPIVLCLKEFHSLYRTLLLKFQGEGVYNFANKATCTLHTASVGRNSPDLRPDQSCE